MASGVFEPYGDDNEVIVTSFTTHATPLIRYRIGDRMIFDDTSYRCPCGDLSPMVKSIEGRKLDFLYNADGAKINSGNVSNILKYLPNVIIHSQFIQERKDEVKLLLEVDKTLYKSEFEELIRQGFAHTFGNATRLIIEYVDEIDREKSGKYKMIKNFIEG